jgi:hypothetical protein
VLAEPTAILVDNDCICGVADTLVLDGDGAVLDALVTSVVVAVVSTADVVVGKQTLCGMQSHFEPQNVKSPMQFAKNCSWSTPITSIDHRAVPEHRAVAPDLQHSHLDSK